MPRRPAVREWVQGRMVSEMTQSTTASSHPLSALTRIRRLKELHALVLSLLPLAVNFVMPKTKGLARHLGLLAPQLGAQARALHPCWSPAGL